ncbi:STAS domain-containing protein [Dactylosporangium roseum]|uniref:Anti-sigma factor antagonist n=1 Tax=Dactylosporangium roseum TaxID=47989 RepID=A0ABY5Z451_9ACTN|nr:STAS domain-containing protein [Dactylosporangium roseum]UWZ36424.1 STAS domain-containing protein [Dactylosporangium roseum]
MALSVDVQTRVGGPVAITLRGELDQSTAQQLRAAVTAALASSPLRLCLDMTLVTFVDSSGFGAMVASHKACHERGCNLTLEGVSHTLYQRLHVTGLTDLFGLTRPST